MEDREPQYNNVCYAVHVSTCAFATLHFEMFSQTNTYHKSSVRTHKQKFEMRQAVLKRQDLLNLWTQPADHKTRLL
mgnify:FL=1